LSLIYTGTRYLIEEGGMREDQYDTWMDAVVENRNIILAHPRHLLLRPSLFLRDKRLIKTSCISKFPKFSLEGVDTDVCEICPFSSESREFIPMHFWKELRPSNHCNLARTKFYGLVRVEDLWLWSRIWLVSLARNGKYKIFLAVDTKQENTGLKMKDISHIYSN